MLIKNKLLKKIILSDKSKILDVANNLNKSSLRIVLIENYKKNFVGVINDGDLRRALIAGHNTNDRIKNIINKSCLISNNEFDFEEKDKILKKNENVFNHIPIIKNNKIFGLYTKNFILNQNKKKIKDSLVIMAGGLGKRLGNLTKHCPKALLKYQDKPLLQHLLENAQAFGFNDFIISVFFLKNKIKKFIKNQNIKKIKINYLEENSPLGTIGSLRLIKKISNDFIVINCDVITNVDLVEILKFHKKNKATLTIGVKQFKYKNPYGVINSKKTRFVSFEEKPEINFNINAGVYVFKKNIIKIIRKEKFKSIEDLVYHLNKKKSKILTYPIFENWLDLGQDRKKLKA
jgi:dTDP-glucose pyrophosphorylase|tara:strand:- start:8273 stop:9313 length:1041 start_codon:yes stop_codon:yes gene_type:complete